MAARLTILLTLVATTAMAAATLEAPTSAGVGSAVDVEVAGSTNERDFVTIVPKGLLVQVKADGPEPLVYATVLLLLLGSRVHRARASTRTSAPSRG